MKRHLTLLCCLCTLFISTPLIAKDYFARPAGVKKVLEPTTLSSPNNLDLPVFFAPNADNTAFIARGRGFSARLDESHVSVEIRNGQNKRLGRIAWSPAQTRKRPNPVGIRPIQGTVNRFVGANRSTWTMGGSAYGVVRYPQVYPGIDLDYHTENQVLEFDFIVAPQADPSIISIAVTGTDQISLRPDGALDLCIESHCLTWQAPIAYQEERGMRVPVKASFQRIAQSEIGFKLGPYDQNRQLIIDPVVSYGSFLGGVASDEVLSVATDGRGHAYVVGKTHSSDFPSSGDAIDPNFDGALTDGFVAKINLSTGALVYATFLGGSQFDMLTDVTVDSAGDVYVVGHTSSADYPTEQAFQSRYGGYRDYFVGGENVTGDIVISKLSNDGQTLLYSTFLGGENAESASSISVDMNGRILVSGITNSVNFPQENALQATHAGGLDAFVVRLTTDGQALDFSTFFGGTEDEKVAGAVQSEDGVIYLAGTTWSESLPMTGTLSSELSGRSDAFIVKMQPNTNAETRGFFLGGTGREEARGIALSKGGHPIIVGHTGSSNFPIKIGPNLTYQGFTDAYVTKVDQDLSQLLFSGFLGGGQLDFAHDVAIDQNGHILVVGDTDSDDMSLIEATQDELSGGRDGVIWHIRNNGTEVLFSTLFGGDARDEVQGIAVDENGHAVIGGVTWSDDLPLNAAFQDTQRGWQDGFIAKLALVSFNQNEIGIHSLSPRIGGSGGQVTLMVHGNAFDHGMNIVLRTETQDVPAQDVRVSEDGQTAFAVLDLNGVGAGTYELMVINPDGESNATQFTVEAEGNSDTFASIVGRDRVRGGRDVGMSFVYGNRGNVDAKGAYFSFSVPQAVEVSLLDDLSPPPGVTSDAYETQWDGFDHWISEDGRKQIEFFAPIVPAGYTGRLEFSLKFGDDGEYELWADSGGPLFKDYEFATQDELDCLESMVRNTAQWLEVVSPVNCVDSTLIQSMIGFGFDAVPRGDGTFGAPVTSLQETIVNFVVTCGIGSLFQDRAFNAGVAALGTGSALGTCVPRFKRVKKWCDAVSSADPNEIVGPQGFGDARYITLDDHLQYAIYFENMPTATAPAQVVVIEDQLDPERFDLESLSLLGAKFGDRHVNFPSGQRTLNTTVDLRPEQELVVAIEADVDTESGEIIWTFTSLDPDTGELPDDPDAGFLPPNQTPPEGDGHVLLSIMLNPSLTTNTTVNNQATIIFDENAPIITNRWSNRIDVTPPQSRIDSLPEVTGQNIFPLDWVDLDDGSGCVKYDIFVSVDGGPFEIWLQGTSETRAFFEGIPGVHYDFISIATDGVGLVEADKETFDASTYIDPKAEICALNTNEAGEQNIICPKQGAPEGCACRQNTRGTPLSLPLICLFVIVLVSRRLIGYYP